jgi:hypothetical protein
MAEAVGLAASIAGLVGIAGQILKGGLFIREFFEDVCHLWSRLHGDKLPRGGELTAFGILLTSRRFRFEMRQQKCKI